MIATKTSTPNPAKELGHDPILHLPIGRIRLSSANDRIYKPIDPNAEDIIALAKSIQRHGIQEPLLISADQFIVSGHRRYAAAKRLGLKKVPCRVAAVAHDEDPDGFIRLLVANNAQRVKTNDELLRETVVNVSKREAYQHLIDHRHRTSFRTCLETENLHTIDIDHEGLKRSRISERKQPMLAAVRKVLRECREFLPLSDRAIHYRLLSDPPLRNSKRPESTYANDSRSYADLCDLLTRARLTGEIAWDEIDDQTRPTSKWSVWQNPQPFLKATIDGFMTGYYRNLMQGQPAHIEIVAEKLTVRSIVEQVAMDFCIPVTIGRGYCSIIPRRDIVERFKATGRDRLVILSLSDHDPDGENIGESLIRSLRDDFGVRFIDPYKVALTREQVEDLKLPRVMKAKTTSTSYTRFKDRHGDDVFELEALPPATLQKLLRNAIETVIDMDAYNEQVAQEIEDAQFLEGVRRRVSDALGNVIGESKC